MVLLVPLFLVAPPDSVFLTPGHSGKTPSGVQLEYVLESHKHAVGGGSVGFYRLSWKTPDGAARSIRPSSDHLCAEVPSSPHLIQVAPARTQRRPNRIRVTIAKLSRRKPLGTDQAMALAHRVARKRGLETTGAASSQENGCHSVSLQDAKNETVLEVYVGDRSGTVLAVREPRPRRRPTPKPIHR